METIVNEFLALGYVLILGTSQKNGSPTAMASRKLKTGRDKIEFNYSFGKEERRTQFLNEFIQTIKNRKERKEQEKKTKSEAIKLLKAADHYTIGDIIVNSWGWEQTNIDFYKVIEVLPKSLKVIQIASEMEPGSMISHGMACKLIPTPANETGDPFILRLKADTNGKIWICNPKSFYYFHKWDGQPKYCSWYA